MVVYVRAGTPPPRTPHAWTLRAPNHIFGGLVRSARDFLTLSSALDAETMASSLCGIWHGLYLVDDDPERVFGEGLVAYAARRPSPHVRAMLAALTAVGSPRVAIKARQAAAAMAAAGVPAPAWVDTVGTATAEAAWLGRDAFGDQDVVLVRFSYAGELPHFTCTLIDHNLGGMAKDAFIGLPGMLSEWERMAAEDELFALRPIPLPEAAARLQEAFATTEIFLDPPVSENFKEDRALGLARGRSIGAPTDLPEPREISPDERAALFAEFRASRYASSLPDTYPVAAAVSRVIDFGCDSNSGEPWRWSPIRAELFLLDWLPRKALLDDEQADALPDALRAWVQFAAERTGLAAAGLAETLKAIEEFEPEFASAMRDPDRAGPAKQVVSAMRADGVDLTDDAAVADWIADYNAALPALG